MELKHLLDILEENGKSIHAYTKCQHACLDYLKSNPHNAMSYFLLMSLAGRFIEAYERQPLPSDRADEHFMNFKTYMECLDEIETMALADQKLSEFNQIAFEVAHHKFGLDRI